MKKAIKNIESALVVRLDERNAFPCFSLKQASKITRAFINQMLEEGEAAGNLIGGMVLHPEKGMVAHVSFNGRVWVATSMEQVRKGRMTEFTGEQLTNHFNQVFA